MAPQQPVGNEEKRRLEEDRLGRRPWKKSGPYLSERQWGTVREDYSSAGDAWAYLPHDHARSRAYRWGEDGLAGFSDDGQRLCLALALWNGRDPILKERLFGLTNAEGNHGEDVKELYYYLDATPTHSYLKMLYKYPQRAFPYAELVEENRRRGKDRPEYELLDTGVFDDDRYFDVFVEYAKAGPDDLLMQVTAHNRGPEAAELHLLPQLWFRNTWAWRPGASRPVISPRGDWSLVAVHPTLGTRVCGGRRRPGSPVLRQRHERPAPVRGRVARLLQRRLSRIRRPRAEGSGQPRPYRDEGGAPLSPHGPRGRVGERSRPAVEPDGTDGL
jgi:hypothetical protein